MDDHTGGPLVVAGTGGAVGLAAAARQVVGAGGQRAQRVGAALGQGARVILAHAVGHLGEPAIQHRGVGGIQPAPQRGGAGVLIGITDA
ncbi:Uncharacterised protein [Mycobacterium tuberculosis]|uniref:Uncharacterized protein n=1 Tax=Mycobacterium tuberculosis TaxID=1773 RepID=A0A655ARK5_MYCTX|nr:Uncharacterised protein [Mycobacterium tuberculosis]CKS37540.1 Uncharacterised protein [Mycobacterium tuberculosis]CKS80718.1 Uncharacterised protein [Mycobacterium tuberculosis]CKT50953.1 Uncharacterised protein [Mycobacterium tuberculosis]